MPTAVSRRLKQAAEWEADPYRVMRAQVERLLKAIRQDYDGLVKCGTPLDYRLAVAKYAAEAKGILHVVAASEAAKNKEDIL